MFEIYKDRKSKWRWRLKVNGRIVADSGQGYSQRFAADRAVKGVKKSVPKAAIKFV